MWQVMVVMAVVSSSWLDGRVQAGPSVPAWMAGCWTREGGPVRAQERWFDTGAGVLMGLSATVRDGRLTEFEFLRVVSDGKSVTYVAQPGGVPPTRFTATTTGPSRVVFENPQHDFPKRIGYERTGERLVAWIDGGEGSKKLEFPMRRSSCDQP